MSNDEQKVPADPIVGVVDYIDEMAHTVCRLSRSLAGKKANQDDFGVAMVQVDLALASDQLHAGVKQLLTLTVKQEEDPIAIADFILALAGLA